MYDPIKSMINFIDYLSRTIITTLGNINIVTTIWEILQLHHFSILFYTHTNIQQLLNF